MAGDTNPETIAWIRKEALATLKQASDSLETYLSDAQSTQSLDACKHAFKQLLGVFQIVELQGPSLLAESLTQLVEMLYLGKIDTSNTPQVAAILLKSMRELPLYLEQVHATSKDHPLILLPLINQVRQLYSGTLLQEVDFLEFNLQLESVELNSDEKLAQAFSAPQTAGLLNEVRQTICNLLDAESVMQTQPDRLNFLISTFSQLERLSDGYELRFFWCASRVICQACLDNHPVERSSFIDVFNEVNNVVSAVIARQPALIVCPPVAPFKKILYFILRHAPRSKSARVLLERYQLTKLLPKLTWLDQQRSVLKQPGDEAFHSVADTFDEELTTVKEQLDLFARGNLFALSEMRALLDKLDSLKKILSVMNLEVPKKLLEKQLQRYQALSDDAQVSKAQLTELANVILYVESAVASLGSKREARFELNEKARVLEAEKRVLVECRSEIETTKGFIVNYIQAGMDISELMHAKRHLKHIEKNLNLIGKIDVVKVVCVLSEFIQVRIIDEAAELSASELELFADSVTAIDCHLERSIVNSKTQDDFLSVAKNKLVALGWPAKRDAKVPAEDASLAKSDASVSEGDAHSLDAPDSDAGQASAVDPPIDGSVDPEIIDIFLEEAQEILFALDQALTPLIQGSTDLALLSAVRRHFHTLKGSGRMVEAGLIGDFSWQIERLLNYFIESRTTFDLEIVPLLTTATQLIPKLVEAFRTNQPFALDSARLEQWVNQRTAGVSIQDCAPIEPLIEYYARIVSDEAATTQPTVNPDVATEDVSNTEDLSNNADGELEAGLSRVFVGEARGHLEQVSHFLQCSDHTVSTPFSTDLLRALHTLKGSSKMAGVCNLSEVVSRVESCIKRLSQAGIRFEAQTKTLLEDLMRLTETVLEHLPNQSVNLDRLIDQIVDHVSDIETKYETPLRELDNRSGTHSAESTWFSQSIEAFEWISEHVTLAVEGAAPDQLNVLFTTLQTLSCNASSLELWPYVQLTDLLKEAYRYRFSEHSMSDEQIQILHDAHQRLVGVADALALGVQAPSIDTVLDRLELLVSAVQEEETGVANAERDELVEIFLEELNEILQSIEQNLTALSQNEDHRIILDAMMRDFHLLKGASELAEIEFMGSLAARLEQLCEVLLDKQLAASVEAIELLHAATGAFKDAGQVLTNRGILKCPQTLIDQLASFYRQLLRSDSVVKRADADADVDTMPQKSTEPSAPSPIEVKLEGLDLEIVGVFIEEAQEIIEHVQLTLEQLSTENALQLQNEVKRSLHTLKGGARLSGFDQLGEHIHDLETRLMSLATNAWGQSVLDDIHRCLDFSADYMQSVSDVLSRSVNEVPNIPSVHSFEPEKNTPISDNTKATERSDITPVDLEILPIFLDEASEIIQDMGQLLAQWDQEPSNSEYLEHLGRLLHTLKGGARLAGVSQIGDHSHEFEAFLSDFEVNPKRDTKALMQGVHDRYDQLIVAIDAMRSSNDLDSPQNSEAVAPENVVSISRAVASERTEAQTESTPPQPKSDGLAFPQGQTRSEQKKQATSKEVIRVASDLLERLVNMAGETSIARARVEQAVNDFSYVLDDMHMTVERMGEKVRLVESQLEAQMLSRNVYPVAEEATHNSSAFALVRTHQEDFDPLEMDRYSLLHHLAKSLSESASDLADLKDTMKDKIRSAESLLMLQSRLNTDLQEGLMQTRMVPFARLSPKLRRVVRQVSSDLGKEVEFEIVNEEGELDRNVLERMVAPLEHMLRNSLDHGIETPEVRLQCGKQPAGKITLSLSREANDVVIRLVDDGAGVDLERVKEKAIKNGLMAADAKLSHDELLQFIFRSGFSTAANVTQISGRGVGMDVVYSEIKQLGGSVKILSESGLGSEFVIRLPFTVAVSRALMVMVAEDFYAIPLTHIEGLVRISPLELKGYYENPEARFAYMSKQYEVHYLGDYVHHKRIPTLDNVTKPIPVLLARNADRAIAIQVDALIGSREIVVKTVGPQLSRVTGLSGATILGDGNVVIILDLNALIRADIAACEDDFNARFSQANATGISVGAPLVMVVDDSVTVRKVTTRLLERNGYEVVTAKDGVDAVTKLREHRPDLMLLDIEMPRMDGFEVASHVRHDPKLKSIPIIMISSRTGEKHKERASAIGVNSFIGKPYQEIVLLSEIQDLVTAARLNA